MAMLDFLLSMNARVRRRSVGGRLVGAGTFAWLGIVLLIAGALPVGEAFGQAEVPWILYDMSMSPWSSYNAPTQARILKACGDLSPSDRSKHRICRIAKAGQRGDKAYIDDDCLKGSWVQDLGLGQSWDLRIAGDGLVVRRTDNSISGEFRRAGASWIVRLTTGSG